MGNSRDMNHSGFSLNLLFTNNSLFVMDVSILGISRDTNQTGFSLFKLNFLTNKNEIIRLDDLWELWETAGIRISY
jgi:hypothetical protein